MQVPSSCQAKGNTFIPQPSLGWAPLLPEKYMHAFIGPLCTVKFKNIAAHAKLQPLPIISTAGLPWTLITEAVVVTITFGLPLTLQTGFQRFFPAEPLLILLLFVPLYNCFPELAYPMKS